MEDPNDFQVGVVVMVRNLEDRPECGVVRAGNLTSDPGGAGDQDRVFGGVQDAARAKAASLQRNRERGSFRRKIRHP